MLQVPSISVPSWLPLQQLFLVAAILVSVFVATRLDGRDHGIGETLRRRWVLGLPWGTVITILSVTSVYWFLQGGWANPHEPVVIAFRSWSYFYPLGVIAAPFSHAGLGHLLGNLLGTLVFAPVTEWVWSHYPTDRGSESFASLGTNPFARILVVPATVFVVGLANSAFALGPVIGFSGVVFAFMGFAFVTRPYLAVIALVSNRTVGLVVRSLRNPQLTANPHPGFITPWWANVAIQGHALGIFLGIVLGLLYLRHRDRTPDGLALWFAALVFGIAQSLWAVYVPVGSSKYILFRAIGVGLMFVLAALVVSAVRASDRTVLDRIDLRRREVAVGLVLAILFALGAVAVPFNLATIEGTPGLADNRTVEIRDYTVTYVEGEPNQYASIIDFSQFGGSNRTIRSSGVVVYSEKRRAWVEAVSKGRLTFAGDLTVTVGGIGWREQVHAKRVGWSVVGGGATYKVFLWHDGAKRTLAYAAETARAEPIIEGRQVAIQPAKRGFNVIVSADNKTLGRSRLPPAGNETRVGGLVLNRTGRDLYAVRNDTRVKVANKQVPKQEQRNNN